MNFPPSLGLENLIDETLSAVFCRDPVYLLSLISDVLDISDQDRISVRCLLWNQISSTPPMFDVTFDVEDSSAIDSIGPEVVLAPDNFHPEQSIVVVQASNL